jgi:hypothetical protein
MAEKMDPKEIVSFEELVMSNVYTQEAIVNLLEKKGILSREEVLENVTSQVTETTSFPGNGDHHFVMLFYPLFKVNSFYLNFSFKAITFSFEYTNICPVENSINSRISQYRIRKYLGPFIYIPV